MLRALQNDCAPVSSESVSTEPLARADLGGVAREADVRGAGLSLISAASEKALAWNIGSALVDGFIVFCIEAAATEPATDAQAQDAASSTETATEGSRRQRLRTAPRGPLLPPRPAHRGKAPSRRR